MSYIKKIRIWAAWFWNFWKTFVTMPPDLAAVIKLNISAAREQQAVGLGHLMQLHHG